MTDFEPDDDWLDAELLADDTSQRNWRRRALGGMSVEDAMMGVPKTGQTNMVLPIEAHRAFRAHIEAMGVTAGVYTRQAVGMRLADEGFPPHLLELFLK